MAHDDTRLVYDVKLSRREQLLMLEIGEDSIDTASSFVNYVNEMYGFSKSSVWYNLNRLKELGLVEFASRDEIGKPLSLTKDGIGQLGQLDGKLRELESYFSNAYMQGASAVSVYAAGVYR